jgi:hypothetical protein
LDKKGVFMKNKDFWLGIRVTVLLFGITVVGCDNGTADGEEGDPKSITITGITGESGDVIIGVTSNYDDDEPTAVGMGTVYGGSVAFSLLDMNANPWTGSGSYYIGLLFLDGETEYMYSNGKSLSDLGLIYNSSDAEFSSKLPKYTISSATSTIAFNQFVEIDEK